MSRVRVASFAISIDGYAAGPDQSLANPLGVGGTELMGWVFPTRSFQRRVPLPVAVKTEDVRAVYKDGVLKIELPKAEVAKPRSVAITVN